MAHIMNCPVCGGTMHEGSLHYQCSCAVLDDLLFRIRQHLSDQSGSPLPDGLKEEILRGSFRSLEDFKRSRLFEAREGGAQNLLLPGMFDGTESLTRLPGVAKLPFDGQIKLP